MGLNLPRGTHGPDGCNQQQQRIFFFRQKIFGGTTFNKPPSLVIL